MKLDSRDISERRRGEGEREEGNEFVLFRCAAARFSVIVGGDARLRASVSLIISGRLSLLSTFFWRRWVLKGILYLCKGNINDH